MAGTRDDVQLLFTRQVDELDRITGYADRKVRVFLFFRMFHRILELLHAEDIDVEMATEFKEASRPFCSAP